MIKEIFFDILQALQTTLPLYWTVEIQPTTFVHRRPTIHCPTGQIQVWFDKVMGGEQWVQILVNDVVFWMMVMHPITDEQPPVTKFPIMQVRQVV